MWTGTLKLVRTHLNYRALGTSTATVFLSNHHSLCTYIPRMDVMLDFICMGPVDLPGARRKRQNTKCKILAHCGTRTHSPEIWSLVLYRLCYPGYLDLNDIITYMYSQYQCIPCYKYNLSCKCTVLCYILEYACIVNVQIAKKRIIAVLAFNT